MKRRNNLKKFRNRLLLIISIVVVFVTTYALIIPAITIDYGTAQDEPGMVIEASDDELTGAVYDEETETAYENNGGYEDYESDYVDYEAEYSDYASDEEYPSDDGDEESDDDTYISEDQEYEGEVIADQMITETYGMEAAAVDEGSAEADEEAFSVAFETLLMPAMKLRYEDEENAVIILVEAEEGTFPAGTILEVTEVEKTEILEAVKTAAGDWTENAVLQTSDVEFRKTEKTDAYDLCFLSPEGEKLEPLKDVRVSLISQNIVDAEETIVIHVEEENLNTTVIRQDEKETEENEIAFKTDQTSIFGFVFIQKPMKVETEEVDAAEAESSAESVEEAVEAEAEEASVDSETEMIDSAAEAAESVFEAAESAPEAAESVLEAAESASEAAESASEAAESVLEAAESVLEAVESSVEPVEELLMPAVTLRYEDEEKGVQILVEAEEGTLPAGTILRVTEIELPEVLEAIETAAEADAENAKRVEKVTAYDICFLSPEGEELEPLKDVRVSMISQEIADAEDTVVVHVEDETLHTTVIEQVEEETEEDEIAFKSGEFSIYGFVFTQKLRASVLTEEGENYTITVYLDENSGIPEDAELSVKELLSGTEEYDDYLNRSAEALEMSEEDVVTFARFFDIEIRKDGEKLEPATPAKVEVAYEDPLQFMEGESLSIVHFAEEGTEVISEIGLDETETVISYEQNSFSVTGTIISGSPSSGTGYMVIVNYNGYYYVVMGDGSLREVEWPLNGNTQQLSVDDPMVWYYKWNTLYHPTDAVSFNWQQVAADYYFRYINPNNANGLDEDTAENTPSTRLYDGTTVIGSGNLDSQPWTGAADWQDRPRWSASHVEYVDHRLTNGSHTSYIGVTEAADGSLHITGGNSYEDSVEVYLAEVSGVPSSDPNRNRVNHIDISIEGQAKVTVPLTRGQTYYYYENGTKKSFVVTERTTIDLSQKVAVTAEDMRGASIRAYTKNADGTTTDVDEAFYISGYSANAATAYSTVQVRIEGSFLVADTPSTSNESWNWQNRLNHRVYYSVSATKSVQFNVIDPEKGQLYDENGDPIAITVEVTLGDSFDYWDERNECPPLQWGFDYGGTYNKWIQGYIADHGLSGMDFKLGGDTDVRTLEITKLIVDEQGNSISPAKNIAHQFEIWYDNDGNPNTVENLGGEQWNAADYVKTDTKTVNVGSDGVGLTYSFGVSDGMYFIKETKDSVPDTIIDKNGEEWVYVRTVFETEYVNRNNGVSDPHTSRSSTKEAGDYTSIPEYLGAEYGLNNSDLQFTCCNVYTKLTDIEVEKKWTQDGNEVTAPDGAQVTLTLGRYITEKSVTGGTEESGSTGTESTGSGSDSPQTAAAVEVYNGSYGHTTYWSDNSSFYPGDTIRISLNKQIQAPVKYSINGGEEVTLEQVSGVGTRTTYYVEVTIPESGTLSVKLSDPWSDVQGVTAKLVSSGSSSAEPTPTPTPGPASTEDSSAALADDANWSMEVVLPDAQGRWKTTVQNLPLMDEYGNEYRYYIKSVAESGVPEGTILSIVKNADGSVYTSTGEEGEVLTAINDLPAYRSVSFTKLWYGAEAKAGDDWPDKIDSIHVTLRRYYESEGQRMTDTAFEMQLELKASEGNGYIVTRANSTGGYVFTVSGLDKYFKREDGSKLEWIYTIEETSLTGYHTNYPATGQSGASGASYTTDGGTVENHLDVYELPHTGGFGTHVFTFTGGSLILLALYLLGMRRKQERRLPD